MSNEDRHPPASPFDATALDRLERLTGRLAAHLVLHLDEDFKVPWKKEEEVGPFPPEIVLLRLFRAADPRAFEGVCRAVARTLVERFGTEHPLAALALAEGGLTDTALFAAAVRRVVESARPDGSLDFGRRAWGGGPAAKTLANLEILQAAGPAEKGSARAACETAALDFLEASMEEFHRSSPALAARAMLLHLRLRETEGIPFARRCLQAILRRWNGKGGGRNDPGDLGEEAEVAAALIEAADRLGEEAEAPAAAWLGRTFSLDRTIPSPAWPERLASCLTALPPAALLEAWSRSALAAVRYLARHRPAFTPASYLLLSTVVHEHRAAKAEKLLSLARPYLPGLERMTRRAPALAAFWTTAPLEKSAFVLHGGNPSPRRDAAVEAVRRVLWDHGVTGRHLEEGGVGYAADPWANASVYMTGCRYAVVLVEREGGVSANLLFALGYLAGQGVEILLLHDRGLPGTDVAALPGLAAPVEGITAVPFDPGAADLSSLREAVDRWARDAVSRSPSPEGEQ